MTAYREGHDEEEPGTPVAATQESDTGPASTASEDADEVDVAFVVFRMKSGMVYPAYSNMAKFGIPTTRDARPDEVYRMCLDLANQISAMRVVGEVLKGVRAIYDSQNQKVTRKPSTDVLE